MAISLVALSAALVVGPAAVGRTPSVRMGLFDGLAAAFANDDSLGERQDAGLKNKVLPQQITWVGPKPEGAAALFEKQKITTQQAIPGASIKDLAEAAGVPISYSCMQGTCHLCDVKINGVETPACMAKLARGKDLTIEYRTADQASAYMKETLQAERMAKKAAKAGAAPTPAAPTAQMTGTVTPTNPFGTLPKNPFGELPKNPFAKASEVPDADDEPPAEESNLELVRRLRLEEQQKQQNKQQGGWPFG